MESQYLLIFKYILHVWIIAVLINCNNANREPIQNSSIKELDNDEEVESGEYIIISPENPYFFKIQFQSDIQQYFHLWFPELVIFEADSSRATVPVISIRNWFIKTSDGFRVNGRIDDSIDFHYFVKPVNRNMIKLELAVKNTGSHPFPCYAQLAVCLAPLSQTFSDTIGDRTFINVKESELKAVNEVAVFDNFNHYPVRPKTDLSDSVQRIQVSSGYVSRSNKDKNMFIAFFWDSVARVDVNPGGLDCIHSHPAIGPLNPGATIKRTGYILLKEGSASEGLKMSQDLFE